VEGLEKNVLKYFFFFVFFSQATINKKKLWYNTKLNTLNREIQELQKKLEIIQKLQIESFLVQKKTIICKIKNLERYRDNFRKNENKISEENEAIKETNNLNSKLTEIDKKLQTYVSKKTKTF
jgi:hypothetical protein